MLSYFPLRKKKKKWISPGSELHIGKRKLKKIKITQRNTNNNDSGRSDDQTWTGIPFKTIWTAATENLSVTQTCACVVLGLYTLLLGHALLNALFPFLLNFPQFLLFALLSVLCVGLFFFYVAPHAVDSASLSHLPRSLWSHEVWMEWMLPIAQVTSVSSSGL